MTARFHLSHQTLCHSGKMEMGCHIVLELTCLCCHPSIRARTFLRSSLKERKPHSFIIITVLHRNSTNASYSALHNEAANEVSPQQEVWRDLDENSTEHCVCFHLLEQLICTFLNADNRWK